MGCTFIQYEKAMRSSTTPLPALRAVKVLDQLRERLRYMHYTMRTEETNLH
jgi:hypothetical protein